MPSAPLDRQTRKWSVVHVTAVAVAMTSRAANRVASAQSRSGSPAVAVGLSTTNPLTHPAALPRSDIPWIASGIAVHHRFVRLHPCPHRRHLRRQQIISGRLRREIREYATSPPAAIRSRISATCCRHGWTSKLGKSSHPLLGGEQHRDRHRHRLAPVGGWGMCFSIRSTRSLSAREGRRNRSRRCATRPARRVRRG